MQQILDAILAGDTRPEDFAAFELPESYRAVTVRKDETDMFAGTKSGREFDGVPPSPGSYAGLGGSGGAT